MPNNNWKHTLYATDLIAQLGEGLGDFTELRDELVRRIRTAAFYTDNDLVLRDVVNGMQAAKDIQQLDRELKRFTTWGDIGQQVYLEIDFTAEEDDELARHRRDR